MPNSHVTKIYSVQDCKIAKLTADPAGGTATYATSVDVPGIRSLVLSQAMNPKYLKGDNTLLDADVTISEPWVGKLVAAKLSLDVEAVLIGGTVSDTGTTPNMVTTLIQSGGTASSPTVPNYFKLEATASDMDLVGGDYHLTLFKCKITQANFLGFAEEDFMAYDLDIAAVPRLADGQWMQRVFNQTAVSIT